MNVYPGMKEARLGEAGPRQGEAAWGSICLLPTISQPMRERKSCSVVAIARLYGKHLQAVEAVSA